MRGADGKYEFEGELLATSAKAIKMRGDYWEKPEHAEGLWFARRMIDYEFDLTDPSNKRVSIVIPAWMAKKDGLADYE